MVIISTRRRQSFVLKNFGWDYEFSGRGQSMEVQILVTIALQRTQSHAKNAVSPLEAYTADVEITWKTIWSIKQPMNRQSKDSFIPFRYKITLKRIKSEKVVADSPRIVLFPAVDDDSIRSQVGDISVSSVASPRFSVND